MCLRGGKNLLAQGSEAIDDVVVGHVGVGVGRARRPPLVGAGDEGSAQACRMRRVEVEVVAGHHQDALGGQVQPARCRGVGFAVRLVDADHLARDDGVPGEAVATRHVDDQGRRQHRERDHRHARTQRRQRRRKVGPGAQAVPGAPQVRAAWRIQCREPEGQHGLVQCTQVHVVHVERRLHLADNALHGAAPPCIGECVAVKGQPLPGRHPGQFIDQRSVPVQHRAARVEGYCVVLHGRALLVCLFVGGRQEAAVYSPRAG